jgi:prepilin-type N-terminal cleavage/methylation domain-containing protein
MIKRKQQQIIRPSGESGFTIIESLVAILVAAILLAAIAPVIVLSAATRVQARRIEQATQATKSFIDSVKSKSIDAPSKVIELEPLPKDKLRKIEENLITLKKMPVPTKYDKDLYCVNKDGKILNKDNKDVTLVNSVCKNSDLLFYIQAAQIKVQKTDSKEGYRLGIRVYRKEAFDSLGNLTASDGDKKDKQTQRTFAAGVGSIKAPLIEMTTDIGDNTTSFRAFCNRLGVKGGDCN